ncbi:hypothetical protein [Algoriphagus mannitolivorans]|uniref:hypothetical protein n=1 Tax=Algoriphagus mannitolivorans TaxID=226504 RepID=UPI00047A0EBB|nr:hypothetical protein [Algoriphagus mannitolivorans]
MKTVIFILLFLDPGLLLGYWDLKFAEANFNLLNSTAFETLTDQQKEDFIEVNELYLKNKYMHFETDTVFWTDVDPRKKEVVFKKGRWLTKQDTLIIFDYEKIFTYKFLYSVKDKELILRTIFPNGDVARSKLVFSKGISE